MKNQRVITTEEIKKRKVELLELLKMEEKELLENEMAINDLWIRNIEMFLDKAATHRSRVQELQLAIERLNVKLA